MMFFPEGETLFKKVSINLHIKTPENAKALESLRRSLSGKRTHTKDTKVATG